MPEELLNSVGTEVTTRKFNRLRAFARFEIANCWNDLAFVDKLVTGNDGLNFSGATQDFLDRTGVANEKKKKVFQKNGSDFPVHGYEKIDPKNMDG